MEGDGDGAAGAAFKMSSIFHLLGKKIGSEAQAQAGSRKQGREGEEVKMSWWTFKMSKKWLWLV